MKQICFAHVATAGIGITALVSLALAQSDRAEHKVYLLAGNQLTELRLEMGTVKANMNMAGAMVGLTKVKAATEFPGSRATIRLKADEPQTFVLGTNITAPLPEHLESSARYATLIKLEVNKKTGMREAPSLSITGFAGISKTRSIPDSRGIPLNFERYDDHGIKIQPRSPLSPGEYAFLAVGATDPYAPANQVAYYCFGID